VSFAPEFFAPQLVFEKFEMSFSHHVAAKPLDMPNQFNLTDKPNVSNKQMQVVRPKTVR
jgi:hypothetical protein